MSERSPLPSRSTTPNSRKISGWLRERAWWFTLIAGAITIYLITLIPQGSVWWLVATLGVSTIVTITMLVMAWGMPANSRVVWLAFAVAQLFTLIGDVIYNIQVYWMESEVTVGPADIFYFLSIGAALTGLAIITRRLQPVRDVAAWIDTVILTIAGMSFVIMFTVSHIIEAGTWTNSVTIVNVLYPIADVAVLAAVVRLTFVTARRGAPLTLIATAYATYVMADLMYNTAVVQEVSVFPLDWLEALYSAAAVLMLAAILAPGARQMVDPVAVKPPTIGSRRVAWLSLGALTVPIILLYGLWVDHHPFAVKVLAVLSFIVIALVLWRVRGLLRMVESQSDLLKRQARTDPLTGLANRRTLDFQLSRLGENPEAVFTIGMFDIDKFKAYNDTYGHQKADNLLREATDAWKGLFPPPALLARYGGEEFTVVIPNVTGDAAFSLFEKARIAMPDDATVSIGFAAREHGETAESVLQRADAAMYYAKQTGRNRVIPADAVPSES